VYDSFGDGWNGAFLEVKMNGIHIGDFDYDVSYTLDSVYSFTGSTMDFIFRSEKWDSKIHLLFCLLIQRHLFMDLRQVIWTT